MTNSKEEKLKEADEKQRILFQDIYNKKEEINDLKYKGDHLTSTIKGCEEEIRLKTLEIKVLKEKHEENVKHMQSQFQKEKNRIIHEYDKKIEEILVRNFEECSKFEENVKGTSSFI